MQARAITCLPAVMVPPEGIDLPNSRIARLPFEEWLALEGQSRSAPYNKLDSRYDRYPPAFWDMPIDADPAVISGLMPDATQVLIEQVEPELETLYRALHWYTGTVPIHPLRSVTYFDVRSAEGFAEFPDLEARIAQQGVPRRYGESEKEYATQNESPNIALRPADQEPLAAAVSFARRTRNIWMSEPYEFALESLTNSASSGVGWPTRVMLIVSAYEAILLPDGRSELQRRFANRMAAVVSPRFEEVAETANLIRLAYKLRSAAAHGRPLGKLLRKLTLSPESYFARLNRLGVIAFCRIVGYRAAEADRGGDPDALYERLDAAALDEAAFAALGVNLRNGAQTPLTHQWQL